MRGRENTINSDIFAMFFNILKQMSYSRVGDKCVICLMLSKKGQY